MSKNNCILRPLESSDARDIALLANNRKVGAYMREFPYPYTLEDAKGFIDMCFSDALENMYFRVIEIGGKFAGGISLTLGSLNPNHVNSKKAEIGYWLGEEYWGRGIMTDMVNQICSYGFANFDIARIEAEVYSPNIGSMRVLEKAGFEHEAILKKSVFKHGQLLDAHMFAKFR